MLLWNEEKELINVSRKIDRTGEFGFNNNGEKMTIVRYDSARNIDVQFDDGTIVEHREYGAFKKGNVKNPMSPSVYNIGIIGVGKFKPYDKNDKPTKAYIVWKHMLERCYDVKLHEKFPTYKGCEVCQEWWNFQVFAEWYYSHFYEIENEQMALDKDILKKGNKVYSPDTCVFVPQSINKLFTKHDNARGKYYIGVRKHGNKFEAKLSKGNGKAMYLGVFETPKQAFQVYKQAKEDYIKEVAEEYKGKIDNRLYEALMNYEVDIND